MASKALRGFLLFFGAKSWLEKPSKNRYATYLKSLSAIFDFDSLVALDLAWWPFDLLDYLDNYLTNNPETKVFEWGSGASSIWLARRGCYVTSVEHDETWAASLRQYLSSTSLEIKVVSKPGIPKVNAHVRSNKKGFENIDFTNYVDAIMDENEFDIIIIDGRSRNACFEKALAHLSPTGFIILDNSNRSEYRNFYRKFNLREENFCGLTPASPIFTKSTIFSFR